VGSRDGFKRIPIFGLPELGPGESATVDASFDWTNLPFALTTSTGEPGVME
jgi:hypothetical protein